MLTLLQEPQPPPIEAVLELLNDLGAIARDIVLVLDDYHVIEGRKCRTVWRSCSTICLPSCIW